MTTKLSNGLVVATGLDNVACFISVKMYATINVKVDVLNCERQKPTILYALQNSGRIYEFTDVDDNVDFSSASAVTFGVWDSIASGSNQQISKSLGSGITANDTNKILVTLEDSDLNLTATTFWWELWVTTFSGDNKIVARGDFVVQDTRKYD